MSAPTKTLNYKNHTEYWDALARIVGCVSCRINGGFNDHVSIHHINGRVRKMAHFNVLPLCAFHHQNGTEDDPSIHPWKRRFVAKYGTQDELREYCHEVIARRNEAQ